MIWDNIRGHGPIVDMFRRAIQRGRLAHAYLFVGPHGIGKRLFARTLAQCLFCQNRTEAELDACGTCPACKQVQSGSHPDLLTVGCPEGKKELPIELVVGASDRRGREGLCHDLALRPMSANRRVAIIDDAETMNEASANALLKTLEEPPPGSLILLMSPDIDPILPTIRSRCQPVRFAPLPSDDVRDLLLDHRLLDDAAAAHQIAVMAQGSLATARELLEPELRDLRCIVLKHLSAPDLRPSNAAKEVGVALEAFGSDSATQRRFAFWAIRFAVEQLRSGLSRETDVNVVDRLGTMLDRCIESELHLRQTMPVPLCFEALFDALARIQRGAEVPSSV